MATNYDVYLPHLRIEQLHEASGDDTEFEQELLLTFVEQFNSSYDKLKKGLTDKNKDECILYSHDIKGAAKNIGADELARVSLIMEDASKKSDFNIVKNHIEELQTTFEKLQENFKKYLSAKS